MEKKKKQQTIKKQQTNYAIHHCKQTLYHKVCSLHEGATAANSVGDTDYSIRVFDESILLVPDHDQTMMDKSILLVPDNDKTIVDESLFLVPEDDKTMIDESIHWRKTNQLPF